MFALAIVALPVRLSRLRFPDMSSALKSPVVFDTLTSPTVFFVEILPVEFVMAMLPVMSSDLNANADGLESSVVAVALSTVMFPLRFPISTAIAVPDADSAEIFFALKSAAAVPAFTPVAFPAVDTTFILPSFSRTSTPTTPTTSPAPLSTLSAAPLVDGQLVCRAVEDDPPGRCLLFRRFPAPARCRPCPSIGMGFGRLAPRWQSEPCVSTFRCGIPQMCRDHMSNRPHRHSLQERRAMERITIFLVSCSWFFFY